MKVSNDTLERMASDVRTYLAARFPVVLASIRLSGTASDSELWTLWHHVCDERRTPDSDRFGPSPRFANRQRVLPFDWGFELYPDGTNDATLTTALRKLPKML